METPNKLTWQPNAHCIALDGVRGLAILSVTVYRLCKELDPDSSPIIAWIRRLAPMGERGVDLFFVLSGFLITGILMRSKGERFYFRNFIIRRSLRIFPLYFLSLAVGLLLLPQFLKSDAFEIARSNQVYLWTYTSNMKMAWSNQWSFGAFDHFWSLCVEEHFYFLWPVIVLCLTKRRLATFCVALFVITGFTRTIFAGIPGWDVAVSVATCFRADALSAGAIVAIMFGTYHRIETMRKASAVVASLSIPILFLIAFSGRRWLEVPSTLCPVFFAAGLTYLLSSPANSILTRAFEFRGLCWLGKYSYGMYVVQLPLISLIPLRSIAPELLSNPILSGAIYILMMFALILLVAVASYHLFEKRFLRLKRSFA